LYNDKFLCNQGARKNVKSDDKLNINILLLSHSFLMR